MPLCKLPGGRTLAYDDTGSGTPLVLLHAFPLDREMWRPQVAALRESARVITIDLPGFGESPAIARFTIDDAADIVAELLGELKIPKAVVCGLSMGGYIALAISRRHPKFLAGMILADTRAGIDDSQARSARDRSIATVREQGPAALFEGMLPKVVSEPTRRDRPDVVEMLRVIAARQQPESVAAALAALRDRPDANPGLKAVTAPTLVLVGELDTVTPGLSAANLTAQIPGSRLIHLPSAGHLSNVENPTLFNAAVRDFLGQLPACNT